jgi:dTDP-4-dehydrorhamnose reductase
MDNFTLEDFKALTKLDTENFLITGGQGMLGRAFSTQIKYLVPNANICSIDKSDFDLLNIDSLAPFIKFQPTTIIHCAALVDADYCEKFPDEAHNSIVQGTKNIIEFAKINSARIFYPQSFLIFDEPDKIINELTIPNAAHVYARKKIEAESIVLNSSTSSLSIRMAGFFGGNEYDTNFVGMITRHLSSLVKSNTPKIEIGNRIWQPTYTNDLAANSLLLLANNKTGIYHLSSHGHASFYELTKEIALNLNLKDKIEITEVSADLVGKDEPAKRPRSAIMSNSRAYNDGLERQRHWKISLAEYLNQPYFKELFCEYTPNP